MGKKDFIKDKFRERAELTTSRTEMGFQFTISQQLERIAMVKSMITPSDNDHDFIEEVLMFEQCVSVLEDLLINEVEGDNKYEAVLDWIEKERRKITSLENFIKVAYNTNMERRDARDTGRGRVRYNRYRSEIKMKVETKRWRGLIRLMKRHNLLLKRKEWEDEM